MTPQSENVAFDALARAACNGRDAFLATLDAGDLDRALPIERSAGFAGRAEASAPCLHAATSTDGSLRVWRVVGPPGDHGVFGRFDAVVQWRGNDGVVRVVRAPRALELDAPIDAIVRLDGEGPTLRYLVTSFVPPRMALLARVLRVRDKDKQIAVHGPVLDLKADDPCGATKARHNPTVWCRLELVDGALVARGDSTMLTCPADKLAMLIADRLRIATAPPAPFYRSADAARRRPPRCDE